jgi:hypothetical protein
MINDTVAFFVMNKYNIRFRKCYSNKNLISKRALTTLNIAGAAGPTVDQDKKRKKKFNQNCNFIYEK